MYQIDFRIFIFKTYTCFFLVGNIKMRLKQLKWKRRILLLQRWPLIPAHKKTTPNKQNVHSAHIQAQKYYVYKKDRQSFAFMFIANCSFLSVSFWVGEGVESAHRITSHFFSFDIHIFCAISFCGLCPQFPPKHAHTQCNTKFHFFGCCCYCWHAAKPNVFDGKRDNSATHCTYCNMNSFSSLSLC